MVRESQRKNEKKKKLNLNYTIKTTLHNNIMRKITPYINYYKLLEISTN